MDRIKHLLWLIPVFLLCAGPYANAGNGGSRWLFSATNKGKYVNTNSGSSRVSPNLRAMTNKMKARGITRQNARQLEASALSNLLVRVNDEGKIQTYIHVHFFGAQQKALLKTYEIVIEIVNEKFGLVQAWVPFDRIDDVATLPFIKRITPPSYGTTRAGSGATTEGDAVLRANELRALGVDGSGIRVGVISDGADNRADAEATGDLPSNITVFGTCNPVFTTCNEGTAMLEIVHDLAPGAELGFCGGLESSLAMAQCVNDLANTFGADIIVDDLGFFLEPYFEDGPVAQEVAGVVAGGVLYISAAGNDAQTHYQGDYVDSLDGLGSHEIGTNNNVFNVTGNPALVILQWSNPLGSSGDDYDLCLDTELPLPAESCVDNTKQSGTEDPIEARVLNCPGPAGCNLQVRLRSGIAQTLELFVLSGTLNATDQVAADSIFGHPAVPGVLAAAAVDQAFPNTIESFSSIGPSTIRFPALETRQTPSVTATDGVSVTGVGGFPSPFFGTSASAPHVAGVAALVMSGSFSVAQTALALESSAVDLGDPGWDTTFGAGRIDAVEAYLLLNDLLREIAIELDVDDGGNSSNSGCFIATAAYGSPMDTHVGLLREFRDRFLLTNSVGKSFVALYYTYSPSIADFITAHKVLRPVVRWSLLPFVGLSWVALKAGPASTVALIILLLLLAIYPVLHFSRKIRLRVPKA